jgi:hypothetical protein
MDETNTPKPMLLNKETLRTLSDAQLSEANGGFSPLISIIIEITAEICPVTVTLA